MHHLSLAFATRATGRKPLWYTPFLVKEQNMGQLSFTISTITPFLIERGNDKSCRALMISPVGEVVFYDKDCFHGPQVFVVHILRVNPSYGTKRNNTE